jgi:Transposase DDE domain
LPTHAALINARKKIGWGIFRRILLGLYKFFAQDYPRKHLWRGRRVYAIDGSKLNLPRNFIYKKYRLSRQDLFYPQGVASVLYDVVARLPVTATLSRNKNERQAVPQLLQAINSNDLVIYDAGYLSTDLLALHCKLGIDALFRVQPSSFKELTPIWTSKHREELIRIKRKNLDVFLRVIRYKSKGSTIVVATTLLDKNQFATQAIIKLYNKRWNLEEGFKSFKRTLESEKWHSKSAVGVRQEFFVNLIVLFFMRLLELSGRKTTKNKKESHKPSERVAHKAVRACFLDAETCRHIGMSQVLRLYQVTSRYQTKTVLGRAFERISRKPVDKFRQRNERGKRKHKTLVTPEEKKVLR